MRDIVAPEFRVLFASLSGQIWNSIQYYGNKTRYLWAEMACYYLNAKRVILGEVIMGNTPTGIPSSGVLTTLMRTWSATRTVARESIKPKSMTVEAYLLPQHMHHNRAEIQSGDLCGCISCVQMFPRGEIRRWSGAGTTAVCPRCDTAAVVGEGAGFQLTPELLHRAHQLLFEGKGRRA
jgi:hypothetical protein